MSTTRIQSGLSPVTQLQVEETRARTAARIERPTFGSVMRTSADVVLRGVEVGATVVAGPIAGAAVRTARTGLGGGGAAGPLDDGGEQSAIDQMRAMQEQSQSFNMQYMALQEEVQQENRRFTTVSNVLKAKHETAKSAIGNIRS
jgi:hypothetical protein